VIKPDFSIEKSWYKHEQVSYDEPGAAAILITMPVPSPGAKVGGLRFRHVKVY
jgi:hypothetical protein